jgi:hypothetical protein
MKQVNPEYSLSNASSEADVVRRSIYALGSVKKKVAPSFTLPSAQTRPP